MGDDFTVIGSIQVDSSGAVSIQGLNKDLDTMGQKTGGLTSIFKSFGQAATFALGNLISTGIMAAGRAVSDFATSSIQSFRDSQDVIANLNATIASTGGVAGVTSEAAQALAKSLQSVTKFSDESIGKGEAMLLTFTNIGHDVFPQATEAMLNLAQKMGTDASGSAIQLGKALNDPVKGITALRRVGVAFTQEQEDSIKAFVKQGDVMGAQKIILKELNTEFGGLAKAMGATASGQMEIFKNKVDDIKEGVGELIQDGIGKFYSVLGNSGIIDAFGSRVTSLLDSLHNFPNDTVGMFADMLYKFDDISPIFDVLGDAVVRISDSFKLFPGDIVGGIANALYGFDNISPVFDDLGDTIISFTQFLSTMGDWWTQNSPGIIAAADKIVGSLKKGFEDLSAKIAPFVANVLNRIGAWFVENGPLIQRFAMVIADVFSNNIIPAVVAAWDVIQPLLSGILDLVLGLAKVIMQVATGDWAGAWETIKSVAVSVGTNLWKAIKALLNTIAVLFGTNLNQVLATLRSWSTQSWSIVTNWVKNTMNSIKAWFLGIIQGFNDWRNKTFSTVTGFGTDIIDGINSIFDTLVSIFDTALLVIFGLWVMAWDSLLAPFNTSMAQIVSAAKSAFNTLRDFISTTLNTISSVIKSILNTITSSMSSAWNSIRSAASSAWNSIVSAIQGPLNSIVNSVSSMINSLKNSVATGLNSLAQTFYSVFNAIYSWLSGIVSYFVNIGKSIISGMINGIQSGASAFIDAIKNLVNNAIKAAMNVLGAKSPSKRFMEVGKTIPQGLAQGISDAFGVTMKALQFGLTGLQVGAVGANGGGTSSSNINASQNYSNAHHHHYYGTVIFQNGGGNGVSSTDDFMKATRK